MSFIASNVTEKIWSFKGEVEYVDGWFLMKNPFSLMILSSVYLVFVLKLGPAYMKNRPPKNLSNTIIVYNVFQVLYAMYLVYLGLSIILPNGLLCPSCLMETNESRYMITSSIYIYFFAKITELLDTIFFVLRKKSKQVTFLHVYHHFNIVWCTWFTLKYEPSYSTIFLGTINSFVHVIMYTYYGLAAYPNLYKYLWWKKYITALQLVQFVAMLVHATANLKYSGCPPSNTLMITIATNTLLFLYLFGKFYVNEYSKTNEVKYKVKSCD